MHPDELQFALRVLADGGRVTQTPTSRLLRSDHPRSQRAWLECLLGREMLDAWTSIESAVQTGRPSFDARHGMSWVEYYRRHDDAAERFADAMTAATRAFEDALLAADRFPPFDRVIDVGGSRGSLLPGLLESNPGARGVLFDLPEVVARWRKERPDDLGGRLSAPSRETSSSACWRAATCTS